MNLAPDFSPSSRMRRWVVPAFFVAVLALGLWVFRDYGLSVDEYQQRDTGLISLKEVAQRVAPAWAARQPEFGKFNVPLAEYYDRDYGVAFETPVCLAERLLDIQDDGDKFLFRHLCTFLVCFGGLLAVYQLAARRFRDWRLGLLAVLWLLLSPRLFADFFYNDKDAVFLAMFALATNTGVRLLLRPSVGRALVHALVCALTVDVRIMGVLIPLVTVALLGWRGAWREVRWPRLAAATAVFLVVWAALVVACWPYLWPAPLRNFAEAFAHMSTFRWGGVVLYLGDYVAGTALPWHYPLVWMGITTPLLYLAGGLVGIGVVLRSLVQHRWRLWSTEQGMQDALFLSLFGGPLLAVIVFHSVLYDGWRQLYFIYPAFLLLAVRGWTAMAQWRPGRAWWQRALYGATALSMALTAAQMVRDHPMQNVYFNLLAGPHVERRFEMDYWGVGYRLDLAYIVDHETRSTIKIASPKLVTAEFNRLMLPPYQRERLRFVENPDSADYFVTNYRWHPEPYPYPNEVFQLRADGRRVHSVFQLH